MSYAHITSISRKSRFLVYTLAQIKTSFFSYIDTHDINELYDTEQFLLIYQCISLKQEKISFISSQKCALLT